MPKQSKVKSVRSTALSQPLEDIRKYRCCSCGKEYTRQKQNFPATQSPLYKGNNGYAPICRNCLDELFNQYKISIGDEKSALRRICMKFDLYWNEEIYNMLSKANTSTSRVLTYIARSNLIKFQGKTFDNTLDEEYSTTMYTSAQAEDTDDASSQMPKIDQSVIEFWGSGLQPSMYIELENRYKFWLSKYPEDVSLDPGEEALLRQICLLEIDINRSRAANKSVDKLIGTLNNLLGSMNLKPNQKREGENSYIPFGVEIANFEKEHPIINKDPEFEDVDGIRHKITAWFLGHMCKMVNLRNSYVPEYEEEVRKYTIERPTYEEDESDSTPDDIFAEAGVSDG